MKNLSSEDRGVAVWNIVLFFVFPFFFLGVLYAGGNYPRSIPLFDFLIISLAIYRLIRLFVYDSITDFLREWLSSGSAFRRAIYHIFVCPWCAGMWMALFIVFVYIFEPRLWLFLMILAVSALASFSQLLSNLVGWSAEYGRLKTESLKDKMRQE